MAAPDGLLAHLSALQKDGMQRLTSLVDVHKAALSLLIEKASAEILELVQPFESEKPRNKRNKGATRQQQEAAAQLDDADDAAASARTGSKRRGAAAPSSAKAKRGRAAREALEEDSDGDGTLVCPAWGADTEADTAEGAAADGVEAQRPGGDGSGRQAAGDAMEHEEGEQEEQPPEEAQPAPRRSGRARKGAAPAPPPARTSGRAARSRARAQQQQASLVLDIIDEEEPAGDEQHAPAAPPQAAQRAASPEEPAVPSPVQEDQGPALLPRRTSTRRHGSSTSALSGSPGLSKTHKPARAPRGQSASSVEQQQQQQQQQQLEHEQAEGQAQAEDQAGGDGLEQQPSQEHAGHVAASPARSGSPAGIQLRTSQPTQDTEGATTPRLMGAGAQRRSRAASQLVAAAAATRAAAAAAASPAVEPAAVPEDSGGHSMQRGHKSLSFGSGLQAAPLGSPAAAFEGASTGKLQAQEEGEGQQQEQEEQQHEEQMEEEQQAGQEQGGQPASVRAAREASFGVLQDSQAGQAAADTPPQRGRPSRVTRTPRGGASSLKPSAAAEEQTPPDARNAGGAAAVAGTPEEGTPLSEPSAALPPPTGSRVTRSTAKSTLQASPFSFAVGTGNQAAAAAVAAAGPDAAAAAGDSKQPGAAEPGPAGPSNLVSSFRSFLGFGQQKKASPTIAAGKARVKVKALEAAQAARKAEEARLADKVRQREGAASRAAVAKPKASRVPVAPEADADGTDAAAAASSGGQQTPVGAVATAKVAAVERAVAGQVGSGSGGAVRVPVAQPKPAEEEAAKRPDKVADKEADKRRAERDAEAAKKALDKQEREERARRAEAKRHEVEARRRAELEEKQRVKEERAAQRRQQLGAAGGGAAAGGVRLGAAGGGGAVKTAAAGTHHGAKDTRDPAVAKAPAAKAAAPPAAAMSTPVGATLAGSRLRTPGGPAEQSSPSLQVKVLEPIHASGASGGAGGSGQQQAGKPLMPPPTVHKTPAAPPVSDQERHNIEMLKSSPYVNMGSKRTPRIALQPNPHNYEISPYRDDDEATPDRSGKPIPDWARSHNLGECLRRQQHVDPDKVFGAKQTSCPLDDIFKGVELLPNSQPARPRKRQLHQRTSSGDWSRDKVTWSEEIAYKKAMGYV